MIRWLHTFHSIIKTSSFRHIFHLHHFEISFTIVLLKMAR
jgi:hypothetical protein